MIEAYQSKSKLFDLPGNISLVKREQLIVNEGISLVNIVNTLPGINMQSGTLSTNRIVIRGMGSRTPYNSNRIRAYLNEIPLTSADGVSTPEELDMQNLEKIEIIKGPSSALYGSGLGGSINMYTPAVKNSCGNFLTQYGNYNTVKTLISGSLSGKQSEFFTGAGFTHSDGYRENNHYEKASFISTFKWHIGKFSIGTSLVYINTNAEIPSSLGITMFENNPEKAAPSWNAVNGFEKYSKFIGGFSLVYQFNKKISNSLTLFGKWNNSYEKRPFNNLDDQTGEVGFRNKLSIETDKTEWIFGTEFFSENYQWMLDKNDSLINENLEKRKQINLFGMAFIKPNKKINISLAMAFNYIGYSLTDMYEPNGNQSGQHNFPLIFSPRIGFNYKAGKNTSIYASAGHGFSLPSPEETLLPEGNINNDLKPETGMQYETGIRLNIFNQSMKIEASMYWIELINLLVTKRESEDIFTGINAGHTRHQGFEFQINNSLMNYQEFPGKLNSIMSYTISLNHFIDFTDDGNTYDGNDLPAIPNQVAGLQLTWNPLRYIGFYCNLQYFGNQFLNDSNTEYYQGYFLSNLKIVTSIVSRKKWRTNLYLGLNNLTNTKYASMLVVNAIGFGGSEPRYYYPGLPRNLYAGIEFRF